MRVGATYVLVVAGNGMRRYAVLTVACVAAMLSLASPAHALPLASDIRVTGSTYPAPKERSPVADICVWSFLHPESSDAVETSDSMVPATPETPTATAEPCWVAGNSDGKHTVDQTFDSNELSDYGSFDSALRSSYFSHETHRSLRHSNSNQRLKRTDSETYSSMEAASDSLPLVLPRPFEGFGDTKPAFSFATRLFRPPRIEIRLP